MEETAKRLNAHDVNSPVDMKGAILTPPVSAIDEGVRTQKHVLHMPISLDEKQLAVVKSAAAAMNWEDVPVSDVVFVKGSVRECVYLNGHAVVVLQMHGTDGLHEKAKQFQSAHRVIVYDPGADLKGLVAFSNLESISVFGSSDHVIRLSGFTALHTMASIELDGPVESYPNAECVDEKTRVSLTSHSGMSPSAWMLSFPKPVDSVSIHSIEPIDARTILASGKARYLTLIDHLKPDARFPVWSIDELKSLVYYTGLHIMSPTICDGWLSNGISKHIRYINLLSFGLCLPVYESADQSMLLDGQLDLWAEFWTHLMKNAHQLRRVHIAIPPEVKEWTGYTKVVIETCLQFVARAPVSIIPFDFRLVLSAHTPTPDAVSTNGWLDRAWKPFADRLAVPTQTRLDRLFQTKTPEQTKELEWFVMNGSHATRSLTEMKKQTWFDFRVAELYSAIAETSKHRFTIELARGMKES